MPVTTFFSDQEVRDGRVAHSAEGVRHLIYAVREMTNEDWIAVRSYRYVRRRWWRRGEMREFWQIARYVGGAGPWQLHGSMECDRETCITYLQLIADGAFSRSRGYPRGES